MHGTLLSHSLMRFRRPFNPHVLEQPPHGDHRDHFCGQLIILQFFVSVLIFITDSPPDRYWKP